MTSQFTFAVPKPTLLPPESVTWLHVPRGGYGVAVPVDAIVLQRGSKRARILVALKNGTLAERTVLNVNLRPKYKR